MCSSFIVCLSVSLKGVKILHLTWILHCLMYTTHYVIFFNLLILPHSVVQILPPPCFQTPTINAVYFTTSEAQNTYHWLAWLVTIQHWMVRLINNDAGRTSKEEVVAWFDILMKNTCNQHLNKHFSQNLNQPPQMCYHLSQHAQWYPWSYSNHSHNLEDIPKITVATSLQPTHYTENFHPCIQGLYLYDSKEM